MTEYQGIIAKDIQDIDHQDHLHRVMGLVRRSQDCRDRKVDRLEKAETADNTHIGHRIRHQVGPEIHPDQHPLATQKQ